MRRNTKLRSGRFIAAVTLLLTCLVPNVFAQQALSAASSSDLDQLLISKDSGLLTDWRFIGPFGNTAEFARTWAPERDQMAKTHYGHDRVLNLQFVTGKFELPVARKGKGIFYASSEVWLPSGGDWRIYAETAGEMVVFLDGKSTIHRTRHEDMQTTSEVVHLGRGAHHIMVKFNAAAAPFHVAVMPETGGLPGRSNKPNIYRSPETQYTSAALHWPE
ncbi:MAG TPA: hypothetical protein VFU86_20170 [Terriglobales bacterium]|nr:hypothetical protein [Terriglobales bacterium]